MRRFLAALGLLVAYAAPVGFAQAKNLSECRVAGLAHSVLCGSLVRPLDPSRPSGMQITLQYVIVPALARRKLADPVFLLAGGPGQSAIALAPQVAPLLGRLNNRRDLVFVDQRGTGKSLALDCPDAHDDPLSTPDAAEPQIEAMRRCRDRLAALPAIGGVEGLRFFTTTLAMQDLDAVRRELGFTHINLLGASYGTRAALEYMRLYPGVARRSVLDGVVPPDMALTASAAVDAQAAFDAMLAACASDALCRKTYPNLRADWQAVLASLPKDAVVADGVTGRPRTRRLTREMVLGAVRGPLYLPSLAAALPAAIDAAAHGRYEALFGLGAFLAPRQDARLALGMHFAIVCAEDKPKLGAAAPEQATAFDADFEQRYARICADWPRGAVDAGFYQIPRSVTPTLLFSGGADPATPPRHGARVAAALGPAARHVVVGHAGHGLLGVGCVRDLIYRFIDAPSAQAATAIDATCLNPLPRPPVYVPIAAAAEVAR